MSVEGRWILLHLRLLGRLIHAPADSVHHQLLAIRAERCFGQRRTLRRVAWERQSGWCAKLACWLEDAHIPRAIDMLRVCAFPVGVTVQEWRNSVSTAWVWGAETERIRDDLRRRGGSLDGVRFTRVRPAGPRETLRKLVPFLRGCRGAKLRRMRCVLRWRCAADELVVLRGGRRSARWRCPCVFCDSNAHDTLEHRLLRCGRWADARVAARARFRADLLAISEDVLQWVDARDDRDLVDVLLCGAVLPNNWSAARCKRVWAAASRWVAAIANEYDSAWARHVEWVGRARYDFVAAAGALMGPPAAPNRVLDEDVRAPDAEVGLEDVVVAVGDWDEEELQQLLRAAVEVDPLDELVFG
jgi:hypothetical protein